jgi:ABC-type uncharacterized transport system ATPase subunit
VKLLDDVGFDVARGEILAVAGVQGNGQTELAEAILGLRERATGSIRLGGTELLGKSVRQVLDAGVGFVPEDRSTDGLVGPFTVAENLVLDLYGDDRFSRGPSLRLGEVQANARRAVEQFDVRTPSVDAPVQTLSGGNQQKVVIARELSRPLELFLASQPTRGVDVGSIEFIHEQIVAERDKGVAVLIVSTELDEVYALADRIAVFFHGRIMGIVGPDTPRDVLGQMMAGATAEELRAAGVRPDGARRTGAQPAVPPQTDAPPTDAPPTDAPQAGAPQATAQHPKEQA